MKDSFLWLSSASIAIPVFCVREPKLPLLISHSRNLMKLFQNDVGLLMCQFGKSAILEIFIGNRSINKGAIIENYVAEELYALGYPLYYFNSKTQGELDFVIEREGKILPLEVKSGKDYQRHNALRKVMADRNYGIKEAIVFHEGNIETEGNILYAPLYMTMMLGESEIELPKVFFDAGEVNEIVKYE